MTDLSDLTRAITIKNFEGKGAFTLSDRESKFFFDV